MHASQRLGYATVRDVMNSTEFYTNNMAKSANKKISKEEITNTLKWVLQPESEENQFQTANGVNDNVWLNGMKTVVWIVLSIAAGFIIAQLHS